MNLQQAARRRSRRSSHGYGWVNQGPAIARMPIDEAKKLILERGLPVHARARRCHRRWAPGCRRAANPRAAGRSPRRAAAAAAPAAPEGGSRRASARAAGTRRAAHRQAAGPRRALTHMCAPRLIRRSMAIAAITAVVSAAPAVAQVGVTPRAPAIRPARGRGCSARFTSISSSNQQLPLDLAVHRRERHARCGSAILRQAAGDPGARLLRVPDAVHAGAERAGRARSGVMNFEPAGSSTSSP